MAKAQPIHKHPDFSAFISITAERIGATEGIVLKDYWVTAVLQALASSSDLTFLFKGGTSLSKGYSLIQRFSEDVDILILDQANKKPGQSSGVKLLKVAQDVAGSVDGVTIDPKHPDAFAGKTPPKRVSILNYPHSESEDDGGILPYIKLEMSVHSGFFPNEVKPITSLVAQQIMTQASDRVGEFSTVASFNVNCLDPLRTFAEKLNALASAHRKNELTARVRHYYDLFYLLGSSTVVDRLDSNEYREIKANIALVDKELKQFDTAHDYSLPGMSEAFHPPTKLMGELERAYNGSSIYYGDKPDFVAVMERIKLMRSKF